MNAIAHAGAPGRKPLVWFRATTKRGIAETIEIHRPNTTRLARLPAVIGAQPNLAQRGRLLLCQAGRRPRAPQLRRSGPSRWTPRCTHAPENSIGLTRQNGVCYPSAQPYANMAYASRAMPKSNRVSEPAIREALVATRGNVLEVARRLGIHRNALYRRLELLDLDPNSFRSNAGKASESDTVRTVRTAAQPASAHSAEHSRLCRLSPVSPSEAPAKHSRARRTLWVRREHLAELARARRHIAAAHNVDLTDSGLLERFIEDAFQPWVAKQLDQHVHDRSEEKP